ncbi:hypothetical protein D7P23_10035 [Staphylococcus aureus]|uniref:Uncharacterized protein n=1 Tax=Staphylococcus aureus TaxID=1280 RepID=A0A6A9GUX8_STAAU|nr:hypothetical protein B7437_10445 [Staphylococcus aureus]QCQ30092.1 hypothetical protein M013TW_03630 [Staphylococcus aureus subsp. aureus M013]MBD6606591.1 hypothetical protein [Staphylococcus aureus]MBD6764213.1 hypothetical protein [Staphylococcus aureus]MBG1082875.1 hypothetical protein [Staphylococcus aureus]
MYNDPLRIYYCILVFLPSSTLSNFLLQLGQSKALVISDNIHFTSPIVWNFQQSTLPSFIIFLLTFHNMF